MISIKIQGGAPINDPSSIVKEENPINGKRLEIDSEFVRCGDWKVSCDEINDAVLTRSGKFIFPMNTLTLTAGLQHYVFMFSGRKKIENQPFPLQYNPEKPSLMYKMTFGFFAIMITINLLSYIFHLLK